MEENKIDVKELFNDLQVEMMAKLRTTSRNISHPGTKGDATEINWIEWLRKYLPKRYTVDKGFVVDNKGNLSNQIDVIIYDTQFCPFIFNQDDTKFIPAESVYAVFEVKQDLTPDHIRYACDKALSVRKLDRTTQKIEGAERQLAAKKPKNIICGLLTAKSHWTKNNEITYVETYLDKDINKRLDLVCSLESYSYVCQYLQDKVDIQQSAENESLIFLFINLFVLLQKMGNPPAMDIMAYAKAIESLK